MSDFICKKCGSTEYEIKDKPNGTGIAHGLYCAKCGFWHKWLGKEELRQYEKKDSKDEIIARLQAENAALRERLDKAEELPVKIGDTVYKVYDKCDGHNCPYNGDYGQWRCHYEGERRCAPFIKIKQFCYADIPFANKTVFVSREAAEARLKQMQGGEG